MFLLHVHQPPAAYHSERTLDALTKILCYSPAGIMTTAPPKKGEVMHLPGMRLVNHNMQWSSVGACRQLVPPFCLRKTKPNTALLIVQPALHTVLT